VTYPGGVRPGCGGRASLFVGRDSAAGSGGQLRREQRRASSCFARPCAAHWCWTKLALGGGRLSFRGGPSGTGRWDFLLALCGGV